MSVPAAGSRSVAIARWSFVVIFGLGGVNHFVVPDFYLGLMPPFLPYPDALVAISGVTELLTAALLIAPRTVRWGAWSVVAHLVVFLLVHITMVVRPELWPDIPVAGLWVRLVVQFAAIGWARWLAGAVGRATPRSAR